MMKTGLFAKFRKPHEKRLPIHPEHLEEIDESVRLKLYFEQDYGLPFGFSDRSLTKLSGGVLSREELLQQCDIAIIAKPLPEDLKEMKTGSILWGWPHCVQQYDMTQIAIDHKLTLIAWEEMHYWSEKGEWNGHVFYKNNEIAGYAGIHHALNLTGMDGNFGKKLKAVVISYGSVSQGAIKGLLSRGINDITVYTPQNYVITAPKLEGIRYSNFVKDKKGRLFIIHENEDPFPLIHELSQADIIVNGILQDTDDPLMFVHKGEEDQLKSGCLIVDISCDEGMGFPFAIPTSFDNPILRFDQVQYYAVDHTPSYLWNAATWEISKALIPFLKVVMSGADEWTKNETIRKAIEIQNGVVQNPKIMSFQGRAKVYPHAVMA